MKVLLVEDDADQLCVRSMLIEQSGFEAIQAGDATAALRLAREKSPDCAIIDLRLPTEQDGLRLIRQLKSLRSDLHIVVLTGAVRVSQFAEIQLVDSVMKKPVCSAELIRRIAAIARTIS